MKQYPIGLKISCVAVATSAAVPLFGLVVGGIVGGFVAVLLVRGWMH